MPIRERVHVTGVSMGFLEICRYLYGHMAVYDLIKHDKARIQVIASLGCQACLRHCHKENSCF